MSKRHDALSAHERAAGRRYAHVVHSRVEYMWLHPHPPLELLAPPHVWIPAGEDYGGGLNDRHALLPRAAAQVYFRRWDAIVSGEIMRIDPQLRGGLIRNAYAVQGDFFIRTMLRFYNFSVRRFAGTAALRCCEGACWSHACYRRALPTAAGLTSLISSRPDNATLTVTTRALVRSAFGDEEHRDVGSSTAAAAARAAAPRPSAAPSSTPRLGVLASGKYRNELEAAIQHAIALKLPGGQYGLRRAAKRRPEHRHSAPDEVAIYVPPHLTDAFRNATLALRVAERFAMGHNGLSDVGRKRRVVPDSPLLEWRAPPAHDQFEV